ncbi:MAG: hypothetical protein WC997_06680 [Porticoccaceae bacterium]
MTSQRENLLRLHKVTLRYSKVEDRVRMDAQTEAGEVVAFWLTQRLCRELISPFVTYFNNADVACTSASPQSISAVQGFLHHEAKVHKKRALPVAREKAVRVVLPSRAQVRTSSKVIQIALPLQENTMAVLAMRPDEARQWLDILYQQYRRAEWPLDIWPQWIRSVPSADISQVATPGERVH